MTARKKKRDATGFMQKVRDDVFEIRKEEEKERLRALPGPWAVYQCSAHPAAKCESDPGKPAPAEMICPFCERRIKPRFVEIQ